MGEKLLPEESSLLEAWLQAHGAENDDGQYRKDMEAEFSVMIGEIKNHAWAAGFTAGIETVQAASDRIKNTVKEWGK